MRDRIVIAVVALVVVGWLAYVTVLILQHRYQ